MLFTKRTNQSTDWARPYQNTSVLQKSAFDACTAVIASISHEFGVSYYEIHPFSVTTVEFSQYLQNLRKTFGTKPLSLFLDNLAVHRNADVKELAAELDIRLVFNKSNQYDYQPIEETFNLVKQWFRKNKLNRLANGQELDKERMIRESFERVSRKHVRIQIERARERLRNDIE